MPVRGSGGTAIFVNRRLAHRHVPRPGLAVEATSIAIPYGGEELLISSVYNTTPNRLSAADLDALLPPDTPSLLGGDLNAKHRDWGCRVLNGNGRILKRLLTARPDITVAAPTTPTHYHHVDRYRPDILDIALHCAFPGVVAPYTVSDLSSDHLPVLMDLEDGDAPRFPPVEARTVNWARYYEYLDRHPLPCPPPATSAEQLDDQVEDITATLLHAIQAAARPRRQQQVDNFVLPAHLREEIRLRRRLRRVWQRTRCPRAHADLNRQSNRVKALLRTHSSEKWEDFLSSRTTEDGTLWKLAKTLRTTKKVLRPLHGQHGLVYNDADKSEAFADSLEDQFSPHADVFDDRHCQRVESFLEELPAVRDEDLDPFEVVTDREVAIALARLRLKKAPGPDTLGASALRNLSPWVVTWLASIYNSSLRLAHFPSPWKLAKIILIPKPGKDPLFPDHHRPISLLSSLSKILERVILARFPDEFHEAVRPEQYGFRRGHSTTLQVARVVNDLATSLATRSHTTSILIDVSKAFDKVWHEGLIFKLAHSPLPLRLVLLLRSYLENRSFQVSVGGSLSTARPVTSGVPQGSVLGPVLYLWYTNDMPVAPHVKLSLYADDAFYMAKSANLQLSTVYAQRQLDLLRPWLDKWRVKVNAAKSQAICFTRKRYNILQRLPVRLGGTAIPWATQVKYLGVTLDRKLTMTQHVNQRCRLVAGAAASLKPLIGPRSKLTIPTKTLLYKTLLRPALVYAAPAWYHLASTSSQKKLQTAQNKLLRSLTASPWFVRNSVIAASAAVPTIRTYVGGCTATMVDSSTASDWAHIRELFSAPIPQLRRRPLLDDPP